MSGMALARSSNSFKFQVLTGTTASTNIALTGATTSDEIVFVGHFSTLLNIASMVDDTANCSITSAGQMQSATDTSSDQLLVCWNDVTDGANTRSAMGLRFSILTGTTAATNIAVAGSTTDDEILWAGMFDTLASIAGLTDDTANCSFTSDGNLQSATDTSSNMLYVVWNDLTSSSAAATRSATCLQSSILAGTTATTNIAVTGILTSDEILYCAHGSTAALLETLVDITSEVSVTSAGNIQLSTSNTSSDMLWLWWNKTSI